MPEVRVYPADQVDALMKRASDGLHNLLGVTRELYEGKEAVEKRASALAAENAELRKKASSGGKVELQKVASASYREKASAFVRQLADMALISEKEVEKKAAACAASPDCLIDLARMALNLSVAPAPQGYGTTKSASSRSDDRSQAIDRENQLWRNACRNPMGLADPD